MIRTLNVSRTRGWIIAKNQLYYTKVGDLMSRLKRKISSLTRIMRSKPLISVVMPAYNTSKYIVQAIESIVQQTYPNWELLICDDASTDSTIACIRQFQDLRIKVIQNDLNLGYLKTTNLLLSTSQGDYITFQDSDDLSHPKRLENQLEAFQVDQQLGICGTNGYRIDIEGRRIQEITKPEFHDEILKHIKIKNPFIGSSLMIKREVYETVGGYRMFFDGLAFQDYDWAWLVVERFKGKNLNDPLYFYRQRPGSNSKIVNLRRHISPTLVQLLADQREKTGTDLVISKNFGSLERLLSEIEKPYLENPGRLYLEYGLDFSFAKLYGKATKMALMYIRHNPTSARGYKLLLYSIWNSLIDG